MDAPQNSFLNKLPVLAGMDEAAVGFLSGLAREERHAAGAVIVREGEPGNRIFFIASGRVQVVKAHGTPQAVRLAEMAAGDFFGEMSLVESVVRSASIVAAEDTVAFTLRGSDFYQLYQRRPEQYGIVMLNIARDLARRLRALDGKFASVSS